MRKICFNMDIIQKGGGVWPKSTMTTMMWLVLSCWNQHIFSLCVVFSGNVWPRGVTLPHPITATQWRSYQHNRNNLALRTHYLLYGKEPFRAIFSCTESCLTVRRCKSETWATCGSSLDLGSIRSTRRSFLMIRRGYPWSTSSGKECRPT